MTTQTLWLTDYDLYLFGEGTHVRAYEKLGAHPDEARACISRYGRLTLSPSR